MIFSSHHRRLICVVSLCCIGACVVLLPSWLDWDDRAWLVHDTPPTTVISLAPRMLRGASVRTGGEVDISAREDSAAFPPAVQRIRRIFQSAVCDRRKNGNNNNHRGKGAKEVAVADDNPPRLREIRIAAVGDSITYGNGSHANKKTKHGGGNYPLTLMKLLNDRLQRKNHNHSEYASKIVVRNFGVNGATAQDKKSKKEQKFSYRRHPEFADALSFDPHIVIIMLGTNDCKRSKPDLFKRSEFKKSLFYIANALAAKKQQQQQQEPRHGNGKSVHRRSDDIDDNDDFSPWIILVTPPPLAASAPQVRKWNFDPERLQAEIVPAIREIVAATVGLSLIDLNNKFFLAADDQTRGRSWTCPPPSSGNKKSNKNKNHNGDEDGNAAADDDKQDGDDDVTSQTTEAALDDSKSERRAVAAAGTDENAEEASKDSKFRCLFRDGVHPRTAVHNLMAEFFADSLCR